MCIISINFENHASIIDRHQLTIFETLGYTIAITSSND